MKLSPVGAYLERHPNLAAFLRSVKERSGCRNVFISSPDLPKVGGRYLKSNERIGLKPGVSVKCHPCISGGASEESPAAPYCKEWVAALALHGIVPNDWGTLHAEDETWLDRVSMAVTHSSEQICVVISRAFAEKCIQSMLDTDDPDINMLRVYLENAPKFQKGDNS